MGFFALVAVALAFVVVVLGLVVLGLVVDFLTVVFLVAVFLALVDVDVGFDLVFVDFFGLETVHEPPEHVGTGILILK